MTDFIILVNAVTLAVGVLQVILFFKIWRMTNDVRTMRNNLTSNPDDLKKEVRKHLALGEKEKAKEMIINRFLHDIDDIDYNVYYDKVDLKESKAEFDDAKAYLAKRLESIGFDVPDSLKDLDYEEYFKLF